MECETALSNETKTKELSFPALYHVVLDHLGPTVCYGTLSLCTRVNPPPAHLLINGTHLDLLLILYGGINNHVFMNLSIWLRAKNSKI